MFMLSIGSISTTNAQLWSYDFSDEAAFATDWVNGGTNDGLEVWSWNNDPTFATFGSQPAFSSGSADDGFAIFNSDANGENPHDVTLTTANPIDLSMAGTVFLRSENQYAFFTQDGGSIASVGVSTNGMDFTYYPILANVAQNDLTSPNQIVIIELPEAANQAQVWLQFRWEGNFEYAWKIDDITLEAEDPTPSISFGLGTNLFYSPASFAQPMAQIDTDTIGFFLDVVNDGGDDITNVVAKAEIQDDAGNVLFADSVIVDIVEAGVTDTIDIPGLWAPGDLAVGVYSVNYEVYSQDIVDPDMSDNSWQRNFLSTTDLYSKDEASTIAFRPGDGGDYFIANVYRTSDNLAPGSTYFGDVAFNGATNAADGAIAGKTATVIIGRVRNDVVDEAWNGFDNTTELTLNDGIELIAFIPHVFEGANFDIQTVPVLDFDENPILMEPGTRYIVGIQYQGADNVIFAGFSEAISYFQISTILFSSQWFLGGFGPEPAATCRLTTTILDSAEDTPLPAESLNIFPNPTSDKLTLDISLENSSSANIFVADISGRVLETREFDNLQNGTYTFDVENYTNGMYMVRLVTEEGSRTLKFSVQK